MPTYVYRCNRCQNQFEQFQKFSDSPLTICPKCQGQIHRVIYPTGIVFKGSGWYITDSRKDSDKSDGQRKSKGESKPETKTEAKPESKVADPTPAKAPSSPPAASA
jgi:putative FmdB family regulatory protein